MRPRDVEDLIHHVLDRKEHTPIFIWGPPGVGKSSSVKAVATDRGIALIDVRMSQKDPTDLRGIQVPDNGTAKWLIPAFLPNVVRDGEEGILFLDEINAAPPLVQTAGYQLIFDRRIGEYVLPPGWTIIAAGNRAGDRAVVHRLSKALANRFATHIDYGEGYCTAEATASPGDLEDWRDWAVVKGIRPEIISFMLFRPELLFKFQPEKDDQAFPTPRTWEYASSWLNLPRNMLSEVMCGCVGDGAGGEFMAYLDVYGRIPDIDRILAGGTSMPNEKDLLFATTTALATRAEQKHLNHVFKYSTKLPAEFAVLLMKMLLTRFDKQAIAKVPSFAADWMPLFQDLLMD
ncbi:MAG: MoxR family ATPase [bacterium]